MFLLFLACTAAPEPPPVELAAPPPEPPTLFEEPELPSFDAWPGDPELLPAPSTVSASLAAHDLQTVCATYAAEISYKTDVSVSTMVDRYALLRRDFWLLLFGLLVGVH